MKKTLMVLGALVAVAAQAEVLDRPVGFKIGQRMTVKPYVNLGYTFDTNADSTKDGDNGTSWSVNPGLTFVYLAENFRVRGAAFYQYHAYSSGYANQRDNSSYGEEVTFNWSNSQNGGRGWSLILDERFQQCSQDDDMTEHGGRGLWRDRREIRVNGALQRRFTEQWHASVNAGYYDMHYDNDVNAYAPLYSWNRWHGGIEAGYTASQWTDILLAANYQGYSQDNNNDHYNTYGDRFASNSEGFSVFGGLGSSATERISYKVLGGYSYFRYANDFDCSGFTYQLSGNWKMADRWTMMMLASSYYQPSETTVASAVRVDGISWGVGHSMIRGKLTATFDICYRHEIQESSVNPANYAYEYDRDILTGRLALNYAINRFFGVYASAEYQTSAVTGNSKIGSDYDYDRWRLSVGLRLTY